MLKEFSFSLDRKFDVVTAGDLIEHLANLDGFFTCVKNHLHLNGKFVISTPNPWCWKYFLYHLFMGRLARINKEHVSWFCLETLCLLGNRYGFKHVKHGYCSRRLYENLVPLPRHIKHTTLIIEFELVS